MEPIRSPLPSHLLALSQEEPVLVAAAADFVQEGLAAGEGAMVITTESRWGRIRDHLRSRPEASAAIEAGALLFVDAAQLAARLSSDGTFRPEHLAREALPPLLKIREATGRAHVRIYGDLVNLLWHRDQAAEALALETCWHDFLKRESITLLCGYHVDLLDAAVDAEALLPLCRAHGHMASCAGGASARQQAVRGAMDAVLGSNGTGRLDILLGAAGMPTGSDAPEDLTLLWLRTEVPHLAQRIMTQAAKGLERRPVEAP